MKGLKGIPDPQGPAANPGVSPDERVAPHADRPTQTRPQGWWQIVKGAWRQSKQDHVSMLAGGVAFFTFLSIFPALLAVMTAYGLVTDPAQAAAQVRSVARGLPPSSRDVITNQLQNLTHAGSGALTVGLAVSLLAALWSASGGVTNLVKAVNLAYDEDETRGFLRLRATAIALTLGGVVFVILAIALVAVLPAALGHLEIGRAHV